MHRYTRYCALTTGRTILIRASYSFGNQIAVRTQNISFPMDEKRHSLPREGVSSSGKDNDDTLLTKSDADHEVDEDIDTAHTNLRTNADLDTVEGNQFQHLDQHHVAVIDASEIARLKNHYLEHASVGQRIEHVSNAVVPGPLKCEKNSLITTAPNAFAKVGGDKQPSTKRKRKGISRMDIAAGIHVKSYPFDVKAVLDKLSLTDRTIIENYINIVKRGGINGDVRRDMINGNPEGSSKRQFSTIINDYLPDGYILRESIAEFVSNEDLYNIVQTTFKTGSTYTMDQLRSKLQEFGEKHWFTIRRDGNSFACTCHGAPKPKNLNDPNITRRNRKSQRCGCPFKILFTKIRPLPESTCGDGNISVQLIKLSEVMGYHTCDRWKKFIAETQYNGEGLHKITSAEHVESITKQTFRVGTIFPNVIALKDAFSDFGKKYGFLTKRDGPYISCHCSGFPRGKDLEDKSIKRRNRKSKRMGCPFQIKFKCLSDGTDRVAISGIDALHTCLSTEWATEVRRKS